MFVVDVMLTHDHDVLIFFLATTGTSTRVDATNCVCLLVRRTKKTHLVPRLRILSRATDFIILIIKINLNSAHNHF